MADLPPQQTDGGQRTLHEYEEFMVIRDAPQIYFLTSGQPDGGARQILDNIDEFDNGRNIPVNSLGFIMPADSKADQFVKNLANKTGGFFRSLRPHAAPQHVISPSPARAGWVEYVRQRLSQWLPWNI